MSAQLHIASIIVRHRDDAPAALDAFLATRSDCECALRAAGRSIVLAEAQDENALLALIDGLQAVPGTLGVTLVHHHSEPLVQMLEELSP